MLEKFAFSRLLFEGEPNERMRLPVFSGSTFRGGMGYVFKKLVCVNPGVECPTCMLWRRCVYPYIFETPPKEGAEMMRRYTRVPNPFVIEPFPDGKEIYEPGDIFRFRVGLIGGATAHYPYFIYTFRELGKKGIGKERSRYGLKAVFSENAKGQHKRVYGEEGDAVKPPHKPVVVDELMKEFPNAPDSITCRFITPARIQYEEKIARRLDFHVLMRNLLRRISMLSYFHCDEKLDLDFAGLIEKAKRIETAEHALEWQDQRRYSTRQKQSMNLGGLVGEVTYKGELKEYMAFLILGQYVHVGKNATFGLGQYEIELK